MISCCTRYWDAMPDLTVYMNCDTRLAINLRSLQLSDQDVFVFAIKNHSYADSSYAFLFQARASDADAHGDVIFKITPAESRKIKQGAIYNFSVLKNALSTKRDTEYFKLSDNGKIIIEYGAQDMTIFKNPEDLTSEIVSIRIEPLEE